jgi:hypothetical protein
MTSRPKIQSPAPSPPPPSPSLRAPTTTTIVAEARAVAIVPLVNARLDHRVRAPPDAMPNTPLACLIRAEQTLAPSVALTAIGPRYRFPLMGPLTSGSTDRVLMRARRS